MFGTTIRVYDPEHDIWQITWIEPGSQTYGRMTGKRQGNDIVQEYRDVTDRCGSGASRRSRVIRSTGLHENRQTKARRGS
jgi:hypothetical protein